MKRFIRIGILCIVAFAGAAFFLCSDALAGSVKPIVATPIDYSVGGEPGEDPHLRERSAMKILPIRSPEGSGLRGTGGYVGTPGREILVSETGDHPYCVDYYGVIWRMVLDTLSGVLSR